MLKKYFTPRGNFLEVNKSLRDKLVFARQDMTADPPFMRVDLISCRNVLIYMNPRLQSKVLSTFHYALKTDGVLFLGRSENVSREDSLFKTVNSRSRVYRKQRSNQTPLAALFLQNNIKAGNNKNVKLPVAADIKPPDILLAELLLSDYTPVAVVFNQRLQVIHIHNNNPAFFRMPSSGPVIQLLQLLRPEFHSETQSLIHLASRKNQPAPGHARKAGNEWVRLLVHPLGGSDELMVLILQSAASGATGLPGARNISPEDMQDADLDEAGLRNELDSTRETLQTVIEELETSNEEMQALNEEIQAANEELQASNEELEASNEELQATNQELISLNEELETRTKQMTSLSAEYEFLYNSLDMPILVFSKEGNLTRTNRTAVQQYGLGPGSIGLNIYRLILEPPLQNLANQVEEVLRNGKNLQIAADHKGRSYIVNVNPGYSKTGEIDQIFVFVTDHTSLVRFEKQLQEKKDQLQAIMDHSFSLLAVKDTTGRYQFVNRRFTEFFGISEDPHGKTDRQVFPDSEKMDLFRRGDAEVLASLAPVFSTESIRTNEKDIILDVIRFPLLDESGAPYAVCTQAEDVTLKKHAEEQLRLAAKVFDHSGEGISITDPAGRIVTVNKAFTKVTGYEPQEVFGKTPAVLKSGKHTEDFYHTMWESLLEKGWWQGEVWNRRKNGSVYPEWLTINAVKDQTGAITHYVGIFSDITAIKESQRRVAYLASHDELTGLANRNLFADELRHALGRASRRKYKIALLYLDLDNFKTINDTLGHETGDLLLKEAARRLQESVRDGDLVVRMGGDEFVLLLEDIQPETVRQIAERVVDYLAASFTIGPHQFFVTCSIGISIYPDDGEDSRILLKNADVAMYRAKEAGRNQYQYFTSEMQVVAQQRLTIQTGLRNALERNEFSLMLQPKVSLEDGSIVSAEALIRWNSHALGNQSPADFIPIAESTGLITHIDNWVIEAVCTILSDWQSRGIRIIPLAVNISPVHFKRGAVNESFRKNLEKFQINPDHIIIELTEGALMDNRSETEESLRALRKTGIRISVDDFGTGYSSLSYLKRYPIDELKIDRSFIDGLADEESDQAITTAIIALARSLGLRTVAEGAETAEQVQKLREIGCDFCQGYYFHRPMSPEELEKLL